MNVTRRPEAHGVTLWASATMIESVCICLGVTHPHWIVAPSSAGAVPSEFDVQTRVTTLKTNKGQR
jgi:hypothetical protein